MTNERPVDPTRRQRPTEPLPRNFRPAWLFLLFIMAVTGSVALAAYLIDRSIYG